MRGFREHDEAERLAVSGYLKGRKYDKIIDIINKIKKECSDNDTQSIKIKNLCEEALSL